MPSSDRSQYGREIYPYESPGNERNPGSARLQRCSRVLWTFSCWQNLHPHRGLRQARGKQIHFLYRNGGNPINSELQHLKESLLHRRARPRNLDLRWILDCSLSSQLFNLPLKSPVYIQHSLPIHSIGSLDDLGESLVWPNELLNPGARLWTDPLFVPGFKRGLW